jgi:DNA-binding NtrC family response regulator
MLGSTKNAPGSPTAIEPEQRATIQVLVVEDDPSLLVSCAGVLRHDGYLVETCGRGEEARDLLRRRPFDVVLLDLHMDNVSGMDLLRLCLQANPTTLVVVMTGSPSVLSSIEALQAGAWDYLPKPFSATHLQILLGRACHAVMIGREGGGATAKEKMSGGKSGKGKEPEEAALLGNSAAMKKTIELARTVARTDASVFISGESGSGKEVIAQFIHQNSRRSSRPLVAVNCAALPETLLESELFGHVKGAFTGAIRDKPGLLEMANGGTFFLDELTEMPLPVQAKLLRVLQDGVVRRVGSESADAVVNVRFIAATNRDARQAVEQNHLRKDLYYRLSVIPLSIPPLRSRTDDIPVLAEHFLRRYWKRHRDPQAPPPRLGTAAIRSLQSQPWAGNVRELQNVMEHVVVLLEPGAEVQPEDIPYLDGDQESSGGDTMPGGVVDLSDVRDKRYHAARGQITAEFEINYLRWLIDYAGSNMSRAAKIAGVDRTTLYRLMEKHGLHRDTVIRSEVPVNGRGFH